MKHLKRSLAGLVRLRAALTRARGGSGARGDHGRRGFTFIEVMVVIALLAIIMIIGVSEVTRTAQRARLAGAANDVSTFAQRALTESRKSNLEVYLNLAAPSADGSSKLQLYSDTDSSGTLNPCGSNPCDSLIAEYTLPAEIALYLPPAVARQSANWSVDTDDTAARSLRVDFKGRTMNPTTSNQITGVATLTMTHVNMVANGARLKPLTGYQLRINPVWHATVTKTVY